MSNLTLFLFSFIFFSFLLFFLIIFFHLHFPSNFTRPNRALVVEIEIMIEAKTFEKSKMEKKIGT